MKTSKTFSSKKDVLSILDLSESEIDKILSMASSFKRNQANTRQLAGRCLAMIFQKPSTRTRVSFEVAMYELGGHALNLMVNDIQVSRGESLEDTAKTLSLYVDCIMARVYDHADIQRLARFSSVPVINGLSNSFHPCQILADLLTIKEIKGTLKGLRAAWLGDGDNVCNDLLLGCAKTGISLTVACPKGYEPAHDVVIAARASAKERGTEITITEDPAVAVTGADIVMTDTFVSIGKEEERAAREAAFLPKYQVNETLMRLAEPDSIFMHCLPAKRGQEVAASVIDGNQSVVWREAENRLHVQKALLCYVINGHN